MLWAKYSFYLYGVAGFIILLGLVAEFGKDKADSKNILAYMFALVLAVALFEIGRRRSRNLSTEEKKEAGTNSPAEKTLD